MSSGPTTEQDIVPGGTGAIVETAAEHKVFPPFDSTTFASQLLWLAITFLLLYWLMAKFIIPRIAGILRDRQDRIAADIVKAEKAKAESEAALAGYEKALAAARSSASGIAETARGESKAAADKERATTEAALAAKLATAEQRIADIKNKALADVGQIAGEATQAIVKSLIDADASAKDIEDAVARAMAGGASVR